MKGFINFLRRLPAWSFTVVVVLAILYLTLVPRPLPPIKVLMFPHADKVIHALMFGAVVLAIVLDYTRKGGTNVMKFTIIGLITGIFFGGMVEVLQATMNMGRSGDWYDLLADIGGALICAGIAPFAARIFITPEKS